MKYYFHNFMKYYFHNFKHITVREFYRKLFLKLGCFFYDVFLLSLTCMICELENCS